MRAWLPRVSGLALILCFAGCVETDLVAENPSATARAEIDPAAAAAQRGDTVRFHAVYYDEFGTRREDVSVQWESVNPAVATVDETGLVTARAAGQAMIRAEADDAVSDPAVLTVVEDSAGVARVVVSPDSVRLVAGASQPFTATAENLSGDPVGDRTFTWQSSDSTVATVDAEGRVTARRAGTAQITARTGGVTSAPASVGVVSSGGSLSGTFVPRPGSGYNVGGGVTLETDGDGTVVVQLEDDFTSSSGPGVHVWLSRSNTVESSSIDLGELQSFEGASTYDAPPSVTLDAFDWVIIHCNPFNVTFGYAELE